MRLVGVSDAEDRETGQPKVCVWVGEGGSHPLDKIWVMFMTVPTRNMCAVEIIPITHRWATTSPD